MVPFENQAADPAGCREQLREALANTALFTLGPAGEATAESRQAAYHAAVALGRCRLFGVDPGADLDGVLPTNLSLAAISTVVDDSLPSWTEQARTLGERWDAALDPFEAEDLCADLLEIRMDLWAVSIALDEARDASLRGNDVHASALGAAMDRLDDAVQALDQVLQEQLDVLSVVAGTELLNNWRQLLAPPYSAILPWWLDGVLEDSARRCEQAAATTLPGPDYWLALRQQRHAYSAADLPVIHDGTLAAASSPEARSGVLPGKALVWKSPDGLWRAELRLPAHSDQDQEQLKRPVNLTRWDEGTPLLREQGEPISIRLGGLEREIDEAGKVWIALAELRSCERLDLEVGNPFQLWQPQPEAEED